MPVFNLKKIFEKSRKKKFFLFVISLFFFINILSSQFFSQLLQNLGLFNYNQNLVFSDTNKSILEKNSFGYLEDKLFSQSVFAMDGSVDQETAKILENKADFVPAYKTAKVVRIIDEKKIEDDDKTYYVQKVQVRFNDDKDNERLVVIDVGSDFQPLVEAQRLKKNQNIIVGSIFADSYFIDSQSSDDSSFKTQETDEISSQQWIVADVYRLPLLIWLTLGFVMIVLVVSGKQGVFSLLGSATSLAVLIYYVAPQLLAGANPLFVSIWGAVGIGFATIYMTHGWNFKSHISFISMMIVLFLVLVLSHTVILLGSFVGMGTEEAYFLQFSGDIVLNLQGLLLAGIVLGALGVLDDIIVSQVSVVFELFKAQKTVSFAKLYSQAIVVGKDHISSLVNTLVLAYAGANLPLFLLIYLNQAAPLWVVVNSEIIAEEIVRTLAGSIGLVMAVPVATVLASWSVFRWKLDFAKMSHSHTH